MADLLILVETPRRRTFWSRLRALMARLHYGQHGVRAIDIHLPDGLGHIGLIRDGNALRQP